MITFWDTSESVGGGSPEFVSSVDFATVSSGTSLVISAPGGIQPGDLLVAFVHMDVGPASLTPPSGFAIDISHVSSAASWFLCSKVATGSEPSSYTFTASSATWGKAITMAAYRGVGTTYLAGTTGTDPATIPSITVPADGKLIVAVTGGESSVVRSITSPPSGLTEREFNSQAAPIYLTSVLFDELSPALGDTGTRSMAWSGNPSNSRPLVAVYGSA